MSVKSFISVAAVAAVIGLAATSALAQITIFTPRIYYPGNAADPETGFGWVPYEYEMGFTEVTNEQYTVFLNAKASSDPFGLYNPNMAGGNGGITRSGSPGSYTYAPMAGREWHPVNSVSFWDACRFANWLHNGQGNGDTETGAYTLTAEGIANNTITRNTGWRWAVPNENEWYKAAYHQPASMGGDSDDYWLFPTQSNTVPERSQANIYSVFNDTTRIGSYAANFYIMFDMGGNVAEWNETIIGYLDRGVRGGSFTSITGLASYSRIRDVHPSYESASIGFRVCEPTIPPCPADFNRDGSADFLDYLDFVSIFSANSPEADFNGDTSIDFFDYLDFADAFSTGC